ncbi:bacteriocin-associated integral membrane family protein [Staphylococcus hyicus]
MKKFKLCLDIIVLLLISGLLYVFTFKEQEEIIPNSSHVITITNWDKTSSKSKVLNTIKAQAKNQNIQIIKIVKDFNQKSSVFLFNKNLRDTASYNDWKESSSFISPEQLVNKELKGKYFVIGKHFYEERLVNALQKQGVTVEIEKINRTYLFIELINENQLLIPLIFLITLYLLYFIYDRGHNFKLYAVQRLHGFSFLQIMLHRSWHRFAYWIIMNISIMVINTIIIFLSQWAITISTFLFRLAILLIIFNGLILILWVISYILLFSINVVLILKGKKSHKILIFLGSIAKCLMILTLSFLLAQNLNSYEKLKNIQQSEKFWKSLNDYYMLEISPDYRNDDDKKVLEKKIYQLVESSEKHDGLLLKNNNVANPEPDNYVPENGNVFFMNHNFMSFYKTKDRHFEGLNDTSEDITVYIPKKFKNQKLAIQKNHQEWANFQKNQNKNVVIHTLSKDVNIFSFDQVSNMKFQYLNAPILMVLEPNDVSKDFYLAAISQGGYLFKDSDSLKGLTKTYQLEEDISGITNYTDSVLTELNETKTQMIITLITIVINICILMIASIFETLQYFDLNKKQLLIKKIHGITLIKSNEVFLLISVCLSMILAVTVYLLFVSLTLLFIVVAVLAIQHLLQGFYIKYLEKHYKELIREI